MTTNNESYILGMFTGAMLMGAVISFSIILYMLDQPIQKCVVDTK